MIGPLNAGPHGFSEIFYALASQWNNNGSAFGGLTGATNFYDLIGGSAMAHRPLRDHRPGARAGRHARSDSRPGPSEHSMPTDAPIFVGLLIGTVLLIGALNFFPALALGPLAEALTGGLF